MFIGYSYNDLTLKYLSRAMASNNIFKRFIFVENDKNDYSYYYLTPIVYGNGEYDRLNRIVDTLADITCKDYKEWKFYFNEYQNQPPFEADKISEIKYCLKNYELCKLLAHSIQGDKWLEWLDKNVVLRNLFSLNISINDIDKIWIKWIVDKILNKYDGSLLELISRHGGLICNELAMALGDCISNKNINLNYFKAYCLLLNQYNISARTIFLLSSKSLECNLPYLALNWFKKLLNYNVYVDSCYDNQIKFDLRFTNYDFLHIVEYSFIEEIAESSPLEFLNFVKTYIENICYSLITTEKKRTYDGVWHYYSV